MSSRKGKIAAVLLGAFRALAEFSILLVLLVAFVLIYTAIGG